MSKAPKNYLLFSPHPATGQVVGISWPVCQTYPSAPDLTPVTEDMVPAEPCPTTDQFQWTPWPTAELSHFKPTCVLWKVTAAARSWRFYPLVMLLLPLDSGRCCVSHLFDHQEKH